MGEHHTPYFGPVTSMKEWEFLIATPVGQLCLWCEEAVVEGDVGTMQAVVDLVDGQPATSSRPSHYECSMRSVIGSVAHLEGRCSCVTPGAEEGDPAGMSRREAAIAAVRLWEKQQRAG